MFGFFMEVSVYKVRRSLTFLLLLSSAFTALCNFKPKASSHSVEKNNISFHDTP